jgi:TonB family protein
MWRFGRPWIGCVLASLLIHGLVLSVAIPRESRTGHEFVEVSLVSGEPRIRPQGAETGGKAAHDRKTGRNTNGAKGDPGTEKVGSFGSEAGRDPAGLAMPRMERTAHGSEASHTEPLVSSELPEKGGFGNATSGAPRGFDKDQGSGDGGMGVGKAASGDERRPSGDGGAGQAIAAFGGPEGPRFVHREMPEYPLYARQRRKEGKVLLMLCITEHGRLLSVEVVEASDPIFADPSVKAVKRSSFAPATQKGVAVPVRTFLPIRFTLNDGTPPSQSRSHE